MVGYVYKTTNLINNKIYICQHLSKVFDSKYLGSGTKIKKAIKKYGKENFRKDILEYCNSKQHMNEREVYWISCFNSRNNNIGYNRTIGGEGVIGVSLTEETRFKLRESHKGHKHSEETKRKMSLAGKGKKKSPFSEEHKRNLSKANLGKKLSKETKEKMSKSRIGRRHTEEAKVKMRESRKGKGNYRLGVSLTEETKKKISETRKRKGLNPPSFKGKKFSLESRLKMSNAHKGLDNHQKGRITKNKRDNKGRFISNASL
jgi:group I intron endonuclease